MKLLVYGAGVLGSLHAARLHEAGVDVSLLARGARLTAIREHGVLLAEGATGSVRAVPVPVVEHPDVGYDLTIVLVRTHQVDAVLESLAGLTGDVLLLVNWAAGPAPLIATLGAERLLLGFPTAAGTMDGEVVRYRPVTAATRFIAMPIGEPDGSTSPRLERVVQTFRAAGFTAKADRHMDAWLTTHAAFETPLGQAVHAAGGPVALAADRDATRDMVRRMRKSLRTMPNRPIPGAFGVLRSMPEAVLVGVFNRFLRSTLAAPLGTTDPAATAELDRMAEQLAQRAIAHGSA